MSDDFSDIFGSSNSALLATARPPVSDATAARISSVKEVLKRSSKAAAPVTAAAPIIIRTSEPGQIKQHNDVVQGSDEWLEMRRGILTASEMKLIITPGLKTAENDKATSHVYEIAAQRISEYVEPHYISDDMLRGQEDEIDARLQYITNYAPVRECGFITNDSLGFRIGYSPDGLVGENGAIECKSRRQKFQIQTIVENVPEETIPSDYVIQIQTGMWVASLDWIDFISYSGGLPMCVVRVLPIPAVQAAIIAAATAFEAKVQAVMSKYYEIQCSGARLVPTERRIEQEISA